MRNGGDLIWLAGELCARAKRRNAAEVEAVQVRHQSWQPETAP
jgi:hypothetical protein